MLCVGLSAIHKAHFICAASELEEPILVVTQDEAAAARLSFDINAMAREERSILFPSRDFTYRQMEGVSGEYEQARLGVLSRLVQGEAKVVVASIQAVMTRTIPKQVLIDNTFTVTPETGMPLDELVSRLVHSGRRAPPPSGRLLPVFGKGRHCGHLPAQRGKSHTSGVLGRRDRHYVLFRSWIASAEPKAPLKSRFLPPEK